MNKDEPGITGHVGNMATRLVASGILFDGALDRKAMAAVFRA
jgi:hypothetical protein